jgi:hypothetical protein
MNPKTVTLTRNDVRQVPVPAKARHLRQVTTCLCTLFIEQTKFDSLSYLGEN